MALAWDDLHLVLSVARGRGLAGAARHLGVDPSTVYRRLGALEASLGSSLFERLAAGYAPTALGTELVAAAERMEQAAEQLAERLESGQGDGSPARLSGTLRLTAPDDVAQLLLLPIVASFRREQPEVEIELTVDNRLLNLTRREADIAVRPTNSPPEHLIGRRSARLTAAVYGPPSLAGEPLESLPWIGWEEGAGPGDYAAWLQRTAPGRRPAFRTGGLLQQASAAAEGLGAALLPCFLGDSDERLQRLTPPIPELAAELWLLTHAEIRRRPVVRHFLDHAHAELKALRGRLAPKEKGA